MSKSSGDNYNTTHMNSVEPPRHTSYKIDIPENNVHKSPNSGTSTLNKSPPNTFWERQQMYCNPMSQDLVTHNSPGIYTFSKLDEQSISSFVNKTLNYVFAQLCVTAAVTAAMYVNKTAINNYIVAHSGVVWIPIILSFVTLGGMFCSSSPDENPIKKVLFCLFTISCSMMVGVSAIQYAPNVVLNATVTLLVMVGFINLYACHCANNGRDLSFMGPSLLGVLIIIITLSILNIFIHSSLLQLTIAGISVIIFSLLLVYDLNRLYNGCEKNDYLRPEPLMAAINIYLDIINIFLSLLQILGLWSSND